MVVIRFLVPAVCLHQCPDFGVPFSSLLAVKRLSFPALLQAKQLIGGFCGRKRYPGQKKKCSSMAKSMALVNLPGHQEVNFTGQKRACVNCANHGSKTLSGRTPETTYGCNRCGVNLCLSACFLQYHTENRFM